MIVGDREALIQDLLGMIKGRAAKLVLKHDASRIVQTCVKHGTAQQRQEIIDELKDHLLALTKSRYGKFLAMKLFKYGNKEQRAFLVRELKGKARKMIKQKDSAEVLETAFSDVMNVAQRQEVLFEIYAPELADIPGSNSMPLKTIIEQGDVLRNNRLYDDVQKLVDKWVSKEMLGNSVVHGVLWEYASCVPEHRREALIASLHDLTMHFAHTAAGSKLAHFLASFGSAKDRKLMVKSVKPHVMGLAMDQHGVVVLLRLLDVMDDTRTAGDGLLKPLVAMETLGSLLVDRNGHLPFLQVLSPANKQYFGPEHLKLLLPVLIRDAVSGEMVPTSKKPASQRRKELLDAVVGPLADFFVAEMTTCTIDEAYGEEKPLNNKHAVNVLYELCVLEDSQSAAANPLLEAFRALIEKQPTILEKFHTSRLLKRVIHAAGLEGAAATVVEFVKQLWSDFAAKGSRFLLFLLRTKGAGYLLVAFLDVPQFADDVRQVLAPVKKKIAEIDQSAAKIVLQKL